MSQVVLIWCNLRPWADLISVTRWKTLQSKIEARKVKKLVILSILHMSIFLEFCIFQAFQLRQLAFKPRQSAFKPRQLAFKPHQSAFHGCQFPLKRANWREWNANWLLKNAKFSEIDTYKMQKFKEIDSYKMLNITRFLTLRASLSLRRALQILKLIAYA